MMFSWDVYSDGSRIYHFEIPFTRHSFYITRQEICWFKDGWPSWWRTWPWNKAK